MTAPGTISTGELMTDASTLVGYLAITAQELTARVDEAKGVNDFLRRQVNSNLEARQNDRDSANAFVDALKEWADNEGVDSDFDDVLVNFGYERRKRDYIVRMSRTVTYTQYGTVTVSASDEDDARGEAYESDSNGYVDFETDSDSEDVDSTTIESVDED